MLKNAFFKTASQYAPIGMALITADGKYIQLNRALCEIVGYTEQELLKKDWQSLTYPEDLPENLSMVEKLLKGKIKRFQLEKRYIHNDGHHVWVQVNTTLVRGENQEPLYFITQIQDITKRKQAEEALRLSESRFRTAMECAPIGMAVQSPYGKYLQVNEAFCEILGYTEEELLTMDNTQLTYRDDLKASEKLQKQLLKGEIQTYKQELRLVHKYGQPICVQLNVAMVKDTNHHPLVMITQVQDITKRFEAENKLKQSEERYRLIQKATNDVIWDWDLVKDRIYVSDNFKTVFKYEPEYVSKQPFKKWWLERMHPEDRDRIMGIWEQVVIRKKESHFSVEYRLLGGDGKYVHLLSQGYVFYKDGKAVRLLGAKIDITTRKEAELALKQSEEKYSQVFDNVSDLISIIDHEANYLLASPSHKAIMGYAPDELVGLNGLSLIHPDDLPKVLQGYHNILSNIPSSATFRVRHKDGHYVTIEGRGKAIFDSYGKPYVLVITSRDISERIELEKRKDNFISRASHELKTPLTTLKALVQILEQEKNLTNREHKYLQKMHVQIEALIALEADLLDVSTMEAGGFKIHDQKFRLDKLVNEVVKDLKPLSNNHAFIVRSKIPVEVVADKFRLSQVLTILITNAVKFSPNAHQLIISCTEEAGIAKISVQDFGIGIAPDQKEKIFDAFYQVNGLMQSRMGLGLGLFIAAQIIKEHKGTIEVASEPGKGSTFTIHLPIFKKISEQMTSTGLSFAT